MENVTVSHSENPPTSGKLIFLKLIRFRVDLSTLQFSHQRVDETHGEPVEHIYDNVPVVPDVVDDYSQVMSASAGPDLFNNGTPMSMKNAFYGSSEDCPTFWHTISGNVSDSAIHSEVPQRTRAFGISAYDTRGRNSYYSSAVNRDWNVVQSQVIRVTRNQSTIETPLTLNDMFKEATSVPATTIQHSKSLVLPPNER